MSQVRSRNTFLITCVNILVLSDETCQKCFLQFSSKVSDVSQTLTPLLSLVHCEFEYLTTPFARREDQ